MIIEKVAPLIYLLFILTTPLQAGILEMVKSIKKASFETT